MKLKREDFDVLVKSGEGEESSGGPSPKGVSSLEDTSDKKKEPKSGKEDGEDKKDGAEKDAGKEGGSAGRGGEDEGDNEGDYSSKIVSGTGGRFPKVGKSMGETLDAEASRELQEALGIPVEVPGEDEAEKYKREAKAAIQKTAKAGTESGLLRRMVARLTQPKIDWKTALKKFIGKAMSTSELTLPNRRHLYKDEYVHGEKWKFDALENAVIAVDTSGSMGDEEITTILNEIYGIIKSKKIKKTRIVYFDAKIQDIDEVSGNRIVFDMERVKGGGGTLFMPPLRFMEEERKKGKMDLAVFCTDGWNADNPLPIPKFKNVFVWVILDNPEFQPPFGNLCVYINRNDLKK